MTEVVKIVVGMRVRSISDGFTRGQEGYVTELGRGGDDDELCAFVRFDSGFTFAVATRLLTPLQ